MEINQRIVLSRHTLGIYEREGLPPINRPIIEEEIQVLRAIAEAHPHKAATLEALVKRCERLLGH